MAVLHLFNPENDLALAANEPHYTPRANAARLADAGALLPAWWADGDGVVCASGSRDEDVLYLEGMFGLKCRPYEPARDKIGGCSVWGWSRYAKEKLKGMGIAESLLPTDDVLDRYRCLSNRALSVAINGYIANNGDGLVLPPPAIVTNSVEDVLRYVKETENRAYIKSPWSSSGRGVFPTNAMSALTLRTQAEGIIRRQGTVTVERALDKVLDFAALYDCSAGEARFVGWSVFDTFDRCAYLGNIVARQGYLEEYIAARLSRPDELLLMRDIQKKAIDSLVAPEYDGVLGVDMMIYKDKTGANTIAPCVEVNLRRTMGMVAMSIAERLSVAEPALFKVEYGSGKALDKNANEVDILLPSNGFRFVLSGFTGA